MYVLYLTIWERKLKMIYNIFDDNDQIIGKVEANSYEAAEQEAKCYIAENGIDRELDYDGHYIEER